jgi:hypothetical protein
MSKASAKRLDRCALEPGDVGPAPLRSGTKHKKCQAEAVWRKAPLLLVLLNGRCDGDAGWHEPVLNVSVGNPAARLNAACELKVMSVAARLGNHIEQHCARQRESGLNSQLPPRALKTREEKRSECASNRFFGNRVAEPFMSSRPSEMDSLVDPASRRSRPDRIASRHPGPPDQRPGRRTDPDWRRKRSAGSLSTRSPYAGGPPGQHAVRRRQVAAGVT